MDEVDCIDPTRCCVLEKLWCVGDLDCGVVCVCIDLWDCSENFVKCEMFLIELDGEGDWSCVWIDVVFVCKCFGDE